MPVKTTKTNGGYTNSTPGGVKGRGMTKRNAMIQKWILEKADKEKAGESYTSRIGRIAGKR